MYTPWQDPQRFRVHFNANCLKGSFCRMVPAIPRARRNCFLYNSDQFPCGLNRRPFPVPQDSGGNPSGEAFFSVVEKDSAKLLFRVGIDHIVSGQGISRIHPHIKRCIRLIGKSEFCSTERIRGNAEVQKQTGDLLNGQHPANIGNLSEIASHDRHSVAERGELFSRRADSVFVLIDCDQPAALPQS